MTMLFLSFRSIRGDTESLDNGDLATLSLALAVGEDIYPFWASVSPYVTQGDEAK